MRAPLFLVFDCASVLREGWMQEISIGLAGGRGDRKRGTVHWKGYGQGSVGTRIGVRCSACGEDATEGGGCGDDSFSDAGGIVEWADSTRCGAG